MVDTAARICLPVLAPIGNNGDTMSYALRIPYDDAVLLASGQNQQEFEKEARFLLAAKLFDLGRLSSGKAAELCGMGRVDFLFSLERAGVSAIQLREEDLEAEVAFGKRA